MSPKHPVPTLKSIAVSYMREKLFSFFSSHRDICKEHGSKYQGDPCTAYMLIGNQLTEMLPSSVREEVLQTILKNDGDFYLKYLCLKVLLRRDVKSVTVTSLPHSLQAGIMKIIMYEGFGLETLIMSCDLSRKNQSLLVGMVCSLKHIKKLTLHAVCTNSALEAIGWNCHYLERLDISFSCHVTTNGVKKLGKYNNRFCKTLDTVVLAALKVEPFAIMMLLKSCKNLTAVTEYKMMGAALAMLQKETREKYCTNLVVFQEKNPTNETILLVSKMCPQLKKIGLEGIHDEVFPSLSLLSNLTDITLTNFSCVLLQGYLAHKGRTVTNLNLEDGSGTLDLSVIGKHCSRLSHLSLMKMEAIVGEAPLNLKNLQEIKVCHSDLVNVNLERLLTAAVAMENVSVDAFVPLKDSTIRRILSKNPLSNLISFWLGKAPGLTRETVWHLMETCPSLRSLGHMGGWSVSKEDIWDILQHICKNNVRLNLMQCFFADRNDPFM